jgi:ribosomal protein S18 acetylase RimI-like enzyme
MSRSRNDLRIRLARLDDAAAIAEVHLSHVPRWYRQIGNKQHEVRYGDLTLDERCGFGGPWASVETCAIHLNNLLLRRQMPMVAEENGRIVGEMEMFVGREAPPYGKNCHIGLLYVRKDAQGRGIGRQMVGQAVKYAKEARCNTLTVASVLTCEEFYRKCGFAFHDTVVEIEAATGDYLVDMSTMPAQVSIQTFTWGMSMKIGRLQSSAYHVFEMGDDFALPSETDYRHVKAFVSVNDNPSLLSYICLPSGTAEVGAWSKGAGMGDLAFAALSDLNRRGIRSARMLLSKSDYERIDDLVDERVLGSRRTLLMKL